MKNTDTAQLPAPIEKQLADLELRHKRHQAKMDDQQDAKFRRREEHRARHFRRSVPPILFV